MMNRLRRSLTCAAMAATMTALFVSPAQAVTEDGGFWASSCLDGRACIEANGPVNQPPQWWNFDGCYFHAFYLLPYYGRAHGNAFRVTYGDGRWDDVEAWSGRRLDGTNETKYVYVYC